MSGGTPPIHAPVMLAEVLRYLAPRDGDVILDGTFGAGGYARAILNAADTRVYGVDRDPDAVARGHELEREFPDRFRILGGRFGEMDRLLAEIGVNRLDGVVLDLGVSSPQIDRPERGFSFRFDGPLDMRMEQAGESAADFVNAADEATLARVIWELGEERFSRRVARAILEARARARIETTGHLASIVRGAVPKSKDGIDSATRTFQAIRIHVNDELGEIDRGLAAAEALLVPGGRLVVVAFHSLEDRRVKTFLKPRSDRASAPSRHLPQPLGAVRAPSFSLVVGSTVKPGAEETARNPRARSARLRVAVRTEAQPWEDAA